MGGMRNYNSKINGDRVRIARSVRLLKQFEAARELGVAENTLRGWKDCPRVLIGRTTKGKGRRVRYDLDEVCAWLKQVRSCSLSPFAGK